MSCVTLAVMKRNEVIQIRLSPEENAVILANAKKAGKKIGPFLRDLGLGPESKPQLKGQSAEQLALARAALLDRPQPKPDTGRRFSAEPEVDIATAGKLRLRVSQLEASGTAPQRAERQAKRELGL